MGELKVYYNSACPVCNAGIRGQKQRMNDCPVDIQWIDIHSRPDALKEIGAQQEFVRERLHVVDEKGEVRVGAEAFRALWAHTPGQGVLARLTGLPPSSASALEAVPSSARFITPCRIAAIRNRL